MKSASFNIEQHVYGIKEKAEVKISSGRRHFAMNPMYNKDLFKDLKNVNKVINIWSNSLQRMFVSLSNIEF